MPSWPVTLPPPALNSLRESPPNNTLRTEMDVGPAKVRRRSTANVRPLSFTLNLEPSQVDVLDDFYMEGTFGGVDAFDMLHPRTDVPVRVRFTQPPEYQEAEGVLYRATVNLEVLP